MARFQLTRAFVYMGGSRRFPAGTVLTDTYTYMGAYPNDIVWTGLNSQTIGPGFAPLDASAVTMKAASIYANEVVSRPTGVDSVGG
jgi:hypothetical protein